MARVFTEGFEFGDTLFFDTVGSSSGAVNTPTITGNYCYKQYTNNLSQKTITGVSEGYFRGRMQITNVTNQSKMFYWRNSTTELGSIRTEATTGKLQIYTSTGTLQATGATGLSINTSYLIEIHIKIDDSSGSIEVRIDGAAPDVTFSGDTKPGAATTFDNLCFMTAGTAAQIYWDDLAFNDTTGIEDNSWCGDGYVILLTPNANGDSSEWTGSDGNSTDNYALVDDIPHDTDTTYVEDSTTDNYDLYNLTACGLSDATHMIRRVWAEARARDTVSAGGIIALVLKTGGSEYDSSDLSLLTSYTRKTGTVHTYNPQSSSAWTSSDLDALQVGPKTRS